MIGHNILQSLGRAEGAHSPPSFPPSWCLETLVHTLSSPTPRSPELSGNATGDDVRGERTGRSPGFGANQLALPKRQIRVPLSPSPWPAPPHPCHKGFTHSLAGPHPKGGTQRRGGGRGWGRSWSRSCAPGTPRFFPAKLTLKRSVQRSRKKWEVTW